MSFTNILFVLFFLSISFFSSAQNPSITKKQNPPSNWHHLSPDHSNYYGIATDEAFKFLDSLKLKPVKITVAVIDADLHINHEDLKGRIWINPEPGKKGYPNDINGWNFLGNKEGALLSKTGTEAFREYKRLRPRYEKVSDSNSLRTNAERKEFAYFTKVRKEAKINSYIQFGAYLEKIRVAFNTTDSIIKVSTFNQEPTVADVLALKVSDPKLQEAQQIVTASMYKYKNSALWKAVYAAQVSESDLAFKRIKSLDEPSTPRDLIGDRPQIKDKHYGNAILNDPGSEHGTLVSGLIAAVRNNGIGIDGIADSVALMGIRAVPDGDEYDKDIALSIYYAVDNGAKLINMSFGKYISPNSKWVNEAIKYANKKGVLLIHAAGNDGKNIDTSTIYPSGMMSAKKRFPNLLRVGASTPSGDAAAISNYGPLNVDLFAPGTSIRSTAANNGYQTANGTSLSAPLATGVAAMLWSYFPQLSMKEIREIMLATVTSRKGILTGRPGKGKDQTTFEKLCSTGGILNAHQAVRMAYQISNSKK